MPDPSAFESIHDHLLASWEETPLVFENQDYDLPDDAAAFVYVEVVGDSMEQDTFGAPGENEWIESGAVYLHVMVPNGTGTAYARQIGNRLIYLFREQPIGALIFRGMSVGAGEPGKTFGNYYAMTVTIEWDRRDVTTLPAL